MRWDELDFGDHFVTLFRYLSPNLGWRSVLEPSSSSNMVTISCVLMDYNVLACVVTMFFGLTPLVLILSVPIYIIERIGLP